MAHSDILERYGNLLKAEQLVTISDKIMPNTFVLEAPEPFPGFFNYYGGTPKDAKPLYLYLVVDRLYTLEEVTRARQNIKTYFSSHFHADAGTVTIYNKTYHVIRVRHLDTYDQIKDLQACFIDQGFVFKKKPSKNIEGTATIRIKKFFQLKEINDGIYLDTIEKDHGYIVIPKYYRWTEFVELNKKAKYNWDGTFFDSALAHFHNNFEIVDMIRVYNPNMNEEMLLGIKKKFYEQIK
ncbi:hypothetical protein [Plebeiibacterium marinum]|uniref:Uncharacterized protein n=1 Tax=Plebeiibacterium marinum TaxID=2992111 RepID=A0AAE3SMK8_9BACT|nr:hypothetical protein [Plebeiobacterium marinum]MCW3807655.1 hypothetical protein [Plebeiobacterium marinum]